MRRVFSATPIHVDDAELDRRRRRYAALAPENVVVDLVDSGAEAPGELGAEADLRASENAVAAAFAKYATADYDYLLPDCVLDPGLPARAGNVVPRPQGMLRLVMRDLAEAGHRVAAVTRNAVIAAELRRKVHEYGFDAAFLSIAVLDLDVERIADSREWNAAVHTALRDLGDHGATAVINGCSAVDVTSPAESGPLVVDPAAAALRLLGSGDGR